LTQQVNSGTLRALVLIMVIVLGLLAYSLYQGSTLEGQVQSLQLMNTELGLKVQAMQLEIDLLKSTTTSSTSPLRFEITSVCVSVGPECPAGGTAGGTGYVYSLGVKNAGSSAILATSSVYLSFQDATVPSSFGFNSTLPKDVSSNSTAYLQATAWPAFTNAASKLSPGDSVKVSITIGSVVNDIDTAVISCTPSTSTATTGNTTVTQTFTCA
jgi:hypothetical protein